MIDQSVTSGGAEQVDVAPRAGETADTISLQLTDLLPDSAGNVVIEYDGGNLAVQLMTDQAIVDRGFAAEAVDAHGGDLSGLAYCVFGDGTTVFFPPEISLHVLPTDT